MLYILPPPSAKPPSVWDLIINFHRKGCQESSGSNNSNDQSSSKKSLKFDCRETKKSQRTWCKTSPSDQSHVSKAAIVFMTSKDLSLIISFTFSREKTRRSDMRRNFLQFSTQNKSWFPIPLHSSSSYKSTSQMRRLLREMKTFRSVFTHGKLLSCLVLLFNVESSKNRFFFAFSLKFSISMWKSRKIIEKMGKLRRKSARKKNLVNFAASFWITSFNAALDRCKNIHGKS